MKTIIDIGKLETVQPQHDRQFKSSTFAQRSSINNRAQLKSVRRNHHIDDDNPTQKYILQSYITKQKYLIDSTVLIKPNQDIIKKRYFGFSDCQSVFVFERTDSKVNRVLEMEYWFSFDKDYTEENKQYISNILNKLFDVIVPNKKYLSQVRDDLIKICPQAFFRQENGTSQFYDYYRKEFAKGGNLLFEYKNVFKLFCEWYATRFITECCNGPEWSQLISAISRPELFSSFAEVGYYSYANDNYYARSDAPYYAYVETEPLYLAFIDHFDYKKRFTAKQVEVVIREARQGLSKCRYADYTSNYTKTAKFYTGTKEKAFIPLHRFLIEHVQAVDNLWNQYKTNELTDYEMCYQYILQWHKFITTYEPAVFDIIRKRIDHYCNWLSGD